MNGQGSSVVRSNIMTVLPFLIQGPDFVLTEVFFCKDFKKSLLIGFIDETKANVMQYVITDLG